jgi:hypothetical protein
MDMIKINQPNLKPLIASILVLFTATLALPAQKQELSEEEAVRLAEQFIAQNGYADLQPDRSKLAYETIERESKVDEMLKGRHDTLERKAYGVVRGRRGAALGWTIVFRYRHPSSKQMRKNGRAVTMNLDGSEMGIEHADFILKYIERKL